MDDRQIPRVVRLVQADLEGEKTDFLLEHHDPLAQPFRLLGQDSSDLFQRPRVAVGQVAVEHVVGACVDRHHLPFVVRLSQVAAPRRKFHFQHDLGRPRRELGIVGHQIDKGQALGVARPGPLLGKGSRSGFGAFQHRLPPGGVRLPLDALLERGHVGGGKQQSRMDLCRQRRQGWPPGGGRRQDGDQEGDQPCAKASLLHSICAAGFWSGPSPTRCPDSRTPGRSPA